MSPCPMNPVMCSTALQMMSNPAPRCLTYAGKRVSVPPPKEHRQMCSSLKNAENVLLSPFCQEHCEVRLLPPQYDAVIPTLCCEVWPRLQNPATMCSPSSFSPKHAVKLLNSPKHAVKLLTSPKHAVKLLTSPKHAVKLLTSPKHTVKLLTSPKHAVKLLTSPKHAVKLLPYTSSTQ